MGRRSREDHGENEPADDKLSAPEVALRRAVHPYRDRRDILILKRRSLERQRADAARAAARRDRIEDSLAVIDDELRDHPESPIDTITLETPCRVRWEDMTGDDVVRRCDRCHREVHDLSHMTRDEIRSLFARSAETPRVRLRRRPDGRVVTADCPIEPPSAAARAVRAVAAGVMFGASAAGAATLIDGEGDALRHFRHSAERVERPAVSAWTRTDPPEGIDRWGGPRTGAPHPIRPAAPSSARSSGGGNAEQGPGWRSEAAEDPIDRDALDRHIRWIAPQAWEVDRVLVERALSSSGLPHEGAWPRPFYRRGRQIGLRLYGVRRQSLSGRLGLRNGDVLLDVNGLSLGSLEQTLRAYERLREESALFVRVERDGEPRLHVYRIIS